MVSGCGIKTRDCNLDRLSLSGFRQPDGGLTQLQAVYTAPEFSFSRHRLNVAVPFQGKCSQAQFDGSSNFFLGFGIIRQKADGMDLALSMTFVLFRMKLISFGRARREAVIAGEFPINLV